MPTSYGAPATATITLDGLGIGEEAISSAIDNSTTKFDKLYVMLKIYTGVVRTQGYLTIGLIYSLDNSTFADKHPSSQEIQIYPPSSLQKIWGFTIENIPQYFKFSVINRTGAALTATTGDNTLNYNGSVN